MEDYLKNNFTPQVITKELNDANKIIQVACVDGKVAAFLVLTKGTSEPCVEHIPQDDRIEVQRVYADPNVQGRGVAHKLMQAAMEIAKKEGYKHAWLGVWEDNVRATRFYEKFGFQKVGEHDFWLGQERQTDYIFACAL